MLRLNKSLCAHLSLVAAFALGVASWSAASANDTVRAVWHVQQITMPYFGLTTHYSCDGLRDKTKSLLKKLGVRDDFVVTMLGCTNLSGPERSPSVRMILANAVPATDAAVKANAADPKRAELLARLARDRKGKGYDDDKPFDAKWRKVVLHVKDSVGASAGADGDCELLEQLRRFVLPKLGAKIVRDNIRCTPYQGTVGNPSMEVEMLVAAPNAAAMSTDKSASGAAK